TGSSSRKCSRYFSTRPARTSAGSSTSVSSPLLLGQTRISRSSGSTAMGRLLGGRRIAQGSRAPGRRRWLRSVPRTAAWQVGRAGGNEGNRPQGANGASSRPSPGRRVAYATGRAAVMSAGAPEVSIVVPAHDEAESLEVLAGEIRGALDGSG